MKGLNIKDIFKIWLLDVKMIKYSNGSKIVRHLFDNPLTFGRHSLYNPKTLDIHSYSYWYTLWHFMLYVTYYIIIYLQDLGVLRSVGTSVFAPVDTILYTLFEQLIQTMIAQQYGGDVVRIWRYHPCATLMFE